MRAASSRQVRLFAVSDQAKRDAVFDDSGQVEKVYGQWVSGDAFAILGVKPALGRVLASTDDINPGQHPVAVLSYDFWTRRFARNPDVLGRWVTIREKPLQIVGVAAKGFTGVEPGIMTDVWAPTMMWDDRAIADPDTRWFRIWGRMQAGVAQEQARTVLQSVFTSFAREQVARRPEESGGSAQAVPQHSCPPAIRRDWSIRAARELRARIVGARRHRRIGAARRLHERREPAGGARGGAAARDGAAGIDWRRTWPIDPAGVDRERTVGAHVMRAGRSTFSRRDAEDRVDDFDGGGDRAPRGRARLASPRVPRRHGRPRDVLVRAGARLACGRRSASRRAEIGRRKARDARRSVPASRCRADRIQLRRAVRRRSVPDELRQTASDRSRVRREQPGSRECHGLVDRTEPDVWPLASWAHLLERLEHTPGIDSASFSRWGLFTGSGRNKSVRIPGSTGRCLYAVVHAGVAGVSAHDANLPRCGTRLGVAGCAAGTVDRGHRERELRQRATFRVSRRWASDSFASMEEPRWLPRK